MKRWGCIFIVSAVSLALTGCIDIFQHLIIDADGLVRTTIRVTISKAVFAMADGLSEDDADFEEIFNENDLNNMDLDRYDQFGTSFEKINDSTDAGYLLSMNIDYRDQDMVNSINKADISFIPRFGKRDITIPIDLLDGSYGSSGDDAMALAFMSTGKYRLLINKNIMADIGRAVVFAGNEETELTVLDLYNDFLVEIPLSILITSAVDLKLYAK